jgi:hypothetical protein
MLLWRHGKNGNGVQLSLREGILTGDKINSEKVERWGIFELSLEGPSDGNPFLDVAFGARFRYKNRVVEPDGFYDGEGVYRVRFMPDTPGVWRYATQSNADVLDGVTGEFTCVKPAEGNHGPVSVWNTYHFAYADGTPYFQVGTTCYAWVHQGTALEEQTLETLRRAPFNKLRMCMFPKDYRYNKNEPEHYPFEHATGGGWDLTRFNPAFFRHLERRVGDLMALGIEADIILFHPYDRWGFACMDAEADDRYLRYTVARLAAYRNVWWSMANEFDLMEGKTMLDWDRFFRVVQESDPYQHLRSVHNCREFYDHNKPWVTHQSIQHADLTQVTRWREACKKPVVVDECVYEGNIPQGWGNLTAQEMVQKFWEGATRGGYVGHGETYLHPEDILWWSKGGVLHGKSPERITFFRRILEESPKEGLEPFGRREVSENGYPTAGKAGEYYLTYFGARQPAQETFRLPEGGRYRAEIIDTWEMVVTVLEETSESRFTIDLPGKPYIAVRLRKVT